MLWRPDSQALYECSHGVLRNVAAFAGAGAAHLDLGGWTCQSAMFLPCRWHGCFWAALVLKPGLIQNNAYVVLQAEGRVLVESRVVPAGMFCSSLTVSARHIAVCSQASPVGHEQGCVLIFAVQSVDQELWLRLHHCILVSTLHGAAQLSPCSVFIAVVTTEPETAGCKPSRPEDSNSWNSPRESRCLLRMEYLGLQASAMPVSLSSWPLPRDWMLSMGALRWAVDSSRLVTTASSQARVHIYSQ